ncbi:MAG: flagellin [Alphaproteobacteria bacterium]|nr:flagellin [Alphaproteobacteria bacterium]
MSQISLTASMRSNLLSLQGTSDLMSQTQERLATGKKVNSAIDNPSSYYTAQSLSNRANDLSSLLDSMGQAISTIKAADEGIEAITSYVEQAKAVANNALDTTDVAARGKYLTQFNSIREQIDKLAADSGYKGINLLKGGSLTVTFNEGRDNQLTIGGVNATTDGDLGIAAAADWAVEKTGTAKTVDADGKIAGGLEASTPYIVKKDDAFYYYNGGAVTADTVFDVNSAVKVEKVKIDGVDKYIDMAASATNINTAITNTTNAISQLRTFASDFGNNYAIVETRESFTTNLINVLEEGADKLTLADMNEESANMLALQTRQQLAINSLSLASQAAQSVLSLF